MASGDVYFNFGSQIGSKRLAEAIAMPFGVGPICGFGSADINGDVLKVYPWAVGDDNGAGSNKVDPARFMMRDLIRNHYIPRAEDADISSYRITFGCIAKDGILFRSGEMALNNIPIEGSKGVYNQVLLFAEHKYVTEPVHNLVSFRAFWNESSFDFFSLYKESLDIYYPSTRKARKASMADQFDPALNEKFSYDYLINKVEAACSTYNNNQKNLVLIGIYGDGINNDPDNGKVEKFAIVPYGGQFPTPIRYNSAIHSYFKEAMKRMETFLDYTRIDRAVDPETGESINFTSLPAYLEWMINQKTYNLQKQIEHAILPVGSIILYDGEEIPPGWEVYEKANGRVVIGYTAGGIQVDNGTFVLQSIGDVYDPPLADDRYMINIKSTDLPKHFHGVGIKRGRQENAADDDIAYVVSFRDRQMNLTGTVRASSAIMEVPNIIKGAVFTGANVTNVSDPTSETTLETLKISKLIPAITLRYIKKSESSINVNQGQGG